MELDKLRTIIAEVLCVDPKEITEETTFVDDLCADSLMCPDRDGIGGRSYRNRTGDAEKISTVGEAVELIRNTR